MAPSWNVLLFFLFNLKNCHHYQHLHFAVSTLENSLPPVIKAYFELELIDVKRAGVKCVTVSSIMYQMPTYVLTSSTCTKMCKYGINFLGVKFYIQKFTRLSMSFFFHFHFWFSLKVLKCNESLFLFIIYGS